MFISVRPLLIPPCSSGVLYQFSLKVFRLFANVLCQGNRQDQKLIRIPATWILPVCHVFWQVVSTGWSSRWAKPVETRREEFLCAIRYLLTRVPVHGPFHDLRGLHPRRVGPDGPGFPALQSLAA